MARKATPQSISEEVVETGPDGFEVLMQYLQSDKGHELASRVVGLVEEVKKATLDKNVEQSKSNLEMEHKHRTQLLWLQGLCLWVRLSRQAH